MHGHLRRFGFMVPESGGHATVQAVPSASYDLPNTTNTQGPGEGVRLLLRVGSFWRARSLPLSISAAVGPW